MSTAEVRFSLPPHLQAAKAEAQFVRESKTRQQAEADHQEAIARSVELSMIRDAIHAQIDPALADFAKPSPFGIPFRVGLSLDVRIVLPGYRPILIYVKRHEDRFAVIPYPSRWGAFGMFGVGPLNHHGSELRWTDDLGEALLLAELPEELPL